MAFPEFAAYAPGAHGVQLVDAELEENWPDTQAVQAEAPELAKVPARQGKQLGESGAPLGEKRPAMQAAQLVEVAAPTALE